MELLLLILALVLIVAGIVKIAHAEVLLGVVLIVLGFLVGPGGISIFT